MYDKQVVRRRRAALGVLVGLSIVLLTTSFGNGSGILHGFQSAAQAVLSPIEEGASRAFKPVRDLVNTVGGVFSASGENKKLKKIGRADLLIACITLAQRATLVTRNLKDFRQVPGLPVENWLD